MPQHLMAVRNTIRTLAPLATRPGGNNRAFETAVLACDEITVREAAAGTPYLDAGRTTRPENSGEVAELSGIPWPGKGLDRSESPMRTRCSSLPARP